MDEKHIADELHTPKAPNASKHAPCSNAAEPSNKLLQSSAGVAAPSQHGSLGIAQADCTNSPVARARTNEPLCALTHDQQAQRCVVV